MHTQIHFKAF